MTVGDPDLAGARLGKAQGVIECTVQQGLLRTCWPRGVLSGFCRTTSPYSCRSRSTGPFFIPF